MGQKAIYKGPFKVIIDDEGHVYPRNQEVEVCTDTASKLSNPPYKGLFRLVDPEGEIKDPVSCSIDGTACC